jgi:formylmethanofuran dehydrogenase subunit E
MLTSDVKEKLNSPEPSKPLKLNIIKKDNIVVSNTNDQQPKNLKLTVTSFSTNINFNKHTKLPTIRKWTLELVYERGRIMHNNRYDYSLVTIAHVQGAFSYIPIKCKICEYIWEATISCHLNPSRKSGCPNCSNSIPWSLERFLKRALSIHNNKFNYSAITEEHIKGKRSQIPLKCNTCEYEWITSIESHINHHSGCPQCAKQVKLTVESFIARSKALYGDNTYDYSLVNNENMKGTRSFVSLICNKCKEIIKVRVSGHLYDNSDCKRCYRKTSWKKDEFIQCAKELHKNKYDYSNILDTDIVNGKSKVLLLCNTCNFTWKTTVTYHINGKGGCPKCNFSKGEIECAKILDKFQIKYEIEFKICSLPKKRYDFMFIYNNIKYLLEFDGEQHFKYKEFFHRNTEKFLYRQQIDVNKTIHAISNGYRIIRISYLDMYNVENCIIEAINSGVNVYFSSPSMYEYITSKLQ